MKYYLKLYKRLVQINLKYLFVYRGNFINSLISSLAWAFFSLVSILLLTSRVSQVSGWSQDAILVLAGTYAIVIGIFHCLFSRNFERFADLIHLGQIESLLLKPADGQFLISCWLVNFTALARVLIGFVVIGYIQTRLQFSITLWHLIAYFFLIGIGVSLLYSIWLLIMTTTIWFTRLSNLVEVLYSVSGIGRYPKEMFLEVSNLLFFLVLPVAITINTPSKNLLQQASPVETVQLGIFALCFFIASRIFWKFALRYYTGASG